MTLSGPGIAHPLRADMLIYEVVMGLFKWLSGAERMEDSKRVLLEKVVEKMRSGADEFAVEVRPGEFGWNGDIDRRLMDYVTQGPGRAWAHHSRRRSGFQPSLGLDPREDPDCH
ncbi:MAG TPA: hypothetical protein VF731_11665, partial [Solirubrobacterales bacterium]